MTLSMYASYKLTDRLPLHTVIFILRLYAVYRRSRTILVCFSIFLAAEISVKIVSTPVVQVRHPYSRETVVFHRRRPIAATTR